MNEYFNKDIFFNNISFLLKEQGKKIGDFENDAGVSPGYISRTNKDPKTKPGIDFVVNSANILKTSIDVLLKCDLSAMTPTECYLVSFLEKLIKDTSDDKLDWQDESADYLNYRIEAYQDLESDHPLFSLQTFYEQSDGDYPDEVTRTVFVSHLFDVHTTIADECFHLRMKNGTMLYVMSICKTVYKVGDPDAHAKELWMCPTNGSNQYLCSNRDIQGISSLIDNLYDVIKQSMSHPKIKKNIKYVMDAFLNDDLEDDPEDAFMTLDDELPFHNVGGETDDGKTSDS